MAHMYVDPISGDPSYWEDDETPPPYAEPIKNTWGGKRREGKTKSSRSVSLDDDVWKEIDDLGGKYSAQINKILKNHFEHLKQMLREAEETE